VGPPVTRTAPVGYRHLVAGVPAVYDEESLTALRHRGQAGARKTASGSINPRTVAAGGRAAVAVSAWDPGAEAG